MRNPNQTMRVFTSCFCLMFIASFNTPLWAQDDAESDADDKRRVRRLSDTTDDQQEWSLDFPTDLNVQSRPVDTPNVSLPDPAQDALLQNALVDVAYNPDDQRIQANLNSILDNVEGQAVQALADGNLVLATQLQQVLAALQPERPAVTQLTEGIQSRRQINELLTAGQTALQENRLIAPENDHAAYYFSQVIELDAANEAASAGLQQIHQNLLDRALAAANELDFETAQNQLDAAGQLGVDDAAVAAARDNVAQVGARRAQDLQLSIGQAIDEGRFGDAEAQLNELIALGDNASLVQRLRESLQDARVYGGFKPGQTFSDNFVSANGQGPLMVVMPAGSFMMGSPESEPGRASNESPHHRVSFDRGFAMGQTEITVDQFRVFINLSGYRTDAERQGDSTVYDEDSGRLSRSRADWQSDYLGQRASGDQPVIHVSWNDANNYALWLSEMTGRRYHLPSEAEFEYAIRGGTQTLYWWGDGSPSTEVENLTGDGDFSRTRRRWNDAFDDYDDGYWGPAEVAQFRPNPFGLFDINGNVKEWVLDCWHDTYVRAPTDGSAWVNQGCTSRVIRGGDWTSTPPLSRSAFRLTASPDTRGARVGFRVVREL